MSSLFFYTQPSFMPSEISSQDIILNSNALIQNGNDTINAIGLSESLLLAVKLNDPVDSLLGQLQSFPFEDLKAQLHTDTAKKAFWINTYNAFFLIMRKVWNLDKKSIYKARPIGISGIQFSLDEIEHGILRRFRYKFSLGYLPDLGARKIIRDLAVEFLDYRIHFALNCGAKSCPPIAFYSANNLDTELNTATRSFILSETDVDHESKEIRLSRLFRWYLADFGGKGGIREVLNATLSLDTTPFKLIFKDYDWEEDLNNFSQ